MSPLEVLLRLYGCEKLVLSALTLALILHLENIQKMCHFKACFLNILMLSFIKLLSTVITKQEENLLSS